MAKARINTDEAQREIADLIDQIRRLENAIDRIAPKGEDGLRRMSMKNHELRKTYERLNTSLDATRGKLAQKRQALDQAKKSTGELGDENEKTGEKAKKAGKKAEGAFGGLLVAVHRLLAAFGLIMGIQLFANIIRNAFKLTLTFDSLRFAMERITETAWAMEQSQQFLLELNKDFGAELIITAERWIKFRAAAIQSNMTLLDTEKIFRSVTKASAVLGLNMDELRSVYLALEQMLSKGKVTTEELRRQLGERLPGAMGIMAASMGVTIPKLDEMLKKGEVLSAEVLPGFADALEVAYGITAVDKVETLRASIGRLTGAWQTMVANIGESEGPIMQVLSSMINGISEFMGFVTKITADAQQRERIDILPFRADWEERIQQQATAALELIEGVYNEQERIEKEMVKNRLDYSKTINEEERKQLNRHYETLVSELVDYNKRVDDQKRGIAAADFFEVENNLATVREQYDQLTASIEILEEKQGGLFSGGKTKEIHNQIEALKERRHIIYGDLLLYQSEYDIKKKLLEVSGDAYVEEETASAKMRKRTVEEIRDLENEVQISILQKVIEGHEAALQAEETGNEKRIQIYKKNLELRNRITELQLAIELDKIRIAEDKKLDALNKPLGDNEIPLTEDEMVEAKTEIALERIQKISIAVENYERKMIANSNDTANKMKSIDKEYAEEAIDIVEDKYNKEIIAAKETYEASAKTTKDKIALDKRLKEIGIEASNAIIDKQIELIKWKLLNLDLDEEVIENYERLIRELEASRVTNDPPENEKEWSDYFATLLDLLRDYNQAVGSLVDGLYGRRIENINAEIEAEKEKYDAMLLLAKDDETQRETIARNRDLRIRELEKKRLKEEQKQAKARKAFAISEIIINTAVAISRVAADAGIFGIPLIPVIAALGAVQIAAVMAQPIPQYKDGGKIQKSEVAMINDGIWQEYVERDGTILTTKRKNAIVGLEAGDIVHKNFNELNNKSDVVMGLTGGTSISESEFNRLFTGIEASVSNGMKKARINNHVHVAPPKVDDGYRAKMARW